MFEPADLKIRKVRLAGFAISVMLCSSPLLRGHHSYLSWGEDWVLTLRTSWLSVLEKDRVLAQVIGILRLMPVRYVEVLAKKTG